MVGQAHRTVPVADDRQGFVGLVDDAIPILHGSLVLTKTAKVLLVVVVDGKGTAEAGYRLSTQPAPELHAAFQVKGNGPKSITALLAVFASPGDAGTVEITIP